MYFFFQAEDGIRDGHVTGVQTCALPISQIRKKFAAYYVIHSSKYGELKELSVSPLLFPFIKEQHQYAKVGDKVSSFQGSNAALGILLMLFPSITVLFDIMYILNIYVFFEIYYINLYFIV